MNHIRRAVVEIVETPGLLN